MLVLEDLRSANDLLLDLIERAVRAVDRSPRCCWKSTSRAANLPSERLAALAEQHSSGRFTELGLSPIDHPGDRQMLASLLTVEGSATEGPRV